MMTVFVTRLAPFISFDIVSYVAGLTKLTLLRFNLATLMGIIPMSFFLAHRGSEVGNGEMESIAIVLFLLGFFVVIPLIMKNLATNSDEGSK